MIKALAFIRCATPARETGHVLFRVISRCTIHTTDVHGITEQSDVESKPKLPFERK
jgi:hypothetical protein